MGYVVTVTDGEKVRQGGKCMFKKIVSFILAMLLICSANVYANELDICETKKLLTELNVINDETFSPQNTVSRGECLKAIMRVIGVTDEDILLLNVFDFYSFADTETYSYFGCADMAKIAYGEECPITYPTYRSTHTMKQTDYFFFPERTVTLKETLAFMVRCLQKDEVNYDSTIETAEKFGLLQSGDEFIDEPDSAIEQDDFCVLLERLLNQKRCKYYQRVNNHFRMEGYIDAERSITYLEFLRAN